METVSLLKYTISNLTKLKDSLEKDKETSEILMNQLLDKIEVIDDYYKSTCFEADDDYDLEPGTTYKTGYNMEMYIESSWWDDVSQIYRKIRPKT